MTAMLHRPGHDAHHHGHGGSATDDLRHIDKENSVLFPLADETLGDDARRELLHAFEAVEQAVVGPGEHDRLVAELARLEAEVHAAR